MDFGALYAEHRDRIFQLSFRLLADREQAIDAVQETFASAFEARDRFRGDCKPITWLYRIAYNLCMDRLGRKGRADVGLDGLDKEDDETSRPESSAERGELRGRLDAALSSLREEDRRVLSLLIDEDLSYEDMASILGCSQESVRMRVSRARKRLRAALDPFLEAPI